MQGSPEVIEQLNDTLKGKDAAAFVQRTRPL